MIVNIRGTSGAGKSTLVRAVMSHYASTHPHYVEKRKQPIGYTLHHHYSGKSLYVPGHYETACGGCDTIKTLDQIFGAVREADSGKINVLFEGMLLCSDTKRIIELAREVPETIIISLTTPIEQCCNNIRKRRAARGETKELDETNTRNRWAYEQKQIVKLKEAGVDIRTLLYEDALDTIKQLFEL